MSRSISARVAAGSAVLISVTALSACGASDEVSAPPSAVTVTSVTTETVTSPSTRTPTTTTTPTDTATTTDDASTSTARRTHTPRTTPPRTSAADDMSTSQRNAVAKGRDYLSYAAFSRKGLIDQLAFEGFSTSDATFAVDYTSPDWTDQAVRKAAEYMVYDSFSRQSLLDQLLFEGFTQTQAAAGADSQF